MGIYAEDGKGFCVEYDLSNLKKIGVIKVDYDKPRPIIDIVKFQSDAKYRLERLKEMISRKSIGWEHEREIRLFGSVGIHCIPKENIKRVIFGVDIQPEQKEYLMNVIAQHLPGLPIYGVALDEKSYEMKIAKI